MIKCGVGNTCGIARLQVEAADLTFLNMHAMHARMHVSYVMLRVPLMDQKSLVSNVSNDPKKYDVNACFAHPLTHDFVFGHFRYFRQPANPVHSKRKSKAS